MTTIVVIGNTTPDEAKATIMKYFGAWTATGPRPATDYPAGPAASKAIRRRGSGCESRTR